LSVENKFEMHPPVTRCIHDRFEAQARERPDALAVVYQEQTLTYAQLNAEANRLAHHLRALGVRPDRPVAICVERSPALLVGLLAILKAGGAYVPLDPTYSAQRLGKILRDADPSLLLLDAHGREALGDEAMAITIVIDVHADASAWTQQSSENPQIEALAAHHLAYVIYTSGSTGTPKGVMVEHAQIGRLFDATAEWFHFTHDDTWCLFHSFAFDFSVWEIWGALAYGGRLVIVPAVAARSPEDFYRLCCAQGVTVLNQTPSAFKAFIAAQAHSEQAHRLRYVIFGGEALDTGMLKPWYARHSDQQPVLINMYGITETTVHVTYRRLGHEDVAKPGSPIGWRIPDLRVYLLDPHGQPVPSGAVGELYVGGAGVARGYLHRAELTAQRFLIDPFHAVPGARMYKTGDLARYLPDGELAFLGRSDEQVKIRGFRIEPGEIEARLLEHPAVREAVVIARVDDTGDQRLVAYIIVADKTTRADLAVTLRAHLDVHLPDYMVPAAFVTLDTLPLTPNGKLDRKALPAPDDAAFARQAYEAPQGDIEQTLAALWEELLGASNVGRQDDFFALGGHSLLAARLLSRLPLLFGTRLPPSLLFEQPTLAALGSAIAAARHDDQDTVSNDAPFEIAPLADHQPMPLSFAQQRLWFLAQLDPHVSASYHIPLAWQLHGPLDVPALRHSLDALWQRHQALRSRFIRVEGQAQLHLDAPDHGLPLIQHDLRALLDPEAAWRHLMIEEASTPFDLVRGPLIRARLLLLDAQRHVLLLTQHHIVSDGWSVGVLTQELNALYRGAHHGQPPSLPALAIQYPDYAAWQRQWLSGARLQAQRDYWQHALTDAPVLLTLPTDRPRPPQQSYAGARLPVRLDAELTRDLKRLSQQHGGTLFIAVMTAWAAVLARLSGQDDLVVGIPTAHRHHSAIEPLIGFFVNTLPLRIDLAGEPNVAELLGRVRASALAMQDHQDLPFEQILEIVQPPRRLEHTPLFQVMFTWHNHEEVQLDLAGLQTEPLQVPYDTTKLDLELSLRECSDGIVGELNYATALFDRATMERQRDYLIRVLRAMVADARQSMSRIDLLGEDERDGLLHTWNRTDAPYPDNACIQQLFEQQAQRHPDNIAIVHQDEALTYQQLNERANRLAHWLIEHGIRPDDRIAICVSRSPIMVVGLLAILKAGGAYVPLDPAYPSERLTQILFDAAPMLLLGDAAGRAALGDAAIANLTVLDVDAAASDWDHCACTNPDPHALGLNSRHLAYVIYTSGSTGTPKGVMVEHRSVVNFLQAMSAVREITDEDRLLAVTSISFDIAGLELYLPLSKGARIVLANHRDSMDPHALQHLLSAQQISIMQATPATWRALLDAHWKGMPGLTMLCGGETLPAELASRLHKHGKALWNLYGPTETTIWSSIHEVRHRGTHAYNPSIGRSIANTRIYLLDTHGQPVPLGAVGEIHIGGDGVARGYFNRPELTADRFLDDPFSKAADARMYKTGDLARYLPDVQLEFLGRNDHQIKIRGFRIELGDIEARLMEYPDVGAATVVAREDSAGEPQLVGYVVPRQIDATRRDNEAGIGPRFSLFFFGAESQARDHKYRLYLESAKFADRHDFEAVWTPERHFHQVGNLYANPATLNAALATITERVKLRAGSVVLPLHDPIRVAEEWAMVDNLSNGRVGIAAASGWHPRDFSLQPGHFANRKQVMADGIETLRALWRGETITRLDGNGDENQIRVYPDPIQPELPIWVTAAGNPETFAHAGRIGAHVLTHLLGQTVSDLAAQIAHYRSAREQAGFDPNTGRVTVMIHTFIGDDLQKVLDRARQPFMNYMQQHIGLLAQWVKSVGIDIDDLSSKDKECVAEFAFERYTRTASFIGTPQSCLGMANQLQDIGVDEIACLIDWMDADSALEALPHLNTLYELSRQLIDRHALRSYLQSKLPDYMVPSALVQLAALPLTPNGKLDRKALPAPDGDAYARRAYEPPQGDIERSLATLWEELLGVDKVGRHDNFFALGGHSLLAVRLFSRLNAALHVDLPLSRLFTHPTIAALARAVAETSRHGEQSPARADTFLEMVPLGPDDALPLSFAQQRLWFLAQLDPHLSAIYQTPLAWQLHGTLDVQALRRSLDAVWQRHQALRSCFIDTGGQARLQIHSPENGLPLIEHDLHALTDPEATWQRLMIEEANTPFDLARGPLIRARLLRLDAQHHVLLLTQHHIVSDGWSLVVLFNELRALYRAFVVGQDNPLPPLTIQYPDYAAWQRQWLSGERLQTQAQYWRAQLADAPVLLELPTDRPRSPQQSFAGATWSVTIDAGLTEQLKRLSQQQGTTLFMTLLAAWAVVLARLSGQQDLVIGTPTANRTRQELEPLIGFFVNTLALRIDLADEPSVADVLERVRVSALAAQDHQDLPFEQVVEIVQPPRRLEHPPLFQVMFAWQNNDDASLDLPGLQIQPVAVPLDWAKFDLLLNLSETRDGIAGDFIYATALFDAATIERHRGYLVNVLRAMVADAQQPVARIDLLSNAERKLLLRDWNETQAPYPRDRCIHELFEAQAQQTPDAIAVVRDDIQLSYAQLNAQANRLAHRLIARGVRPDSRVAICVDRQPHLVVGLLAILKAGGAYVPLDPSYPRERLGELLDDAQPVMLLADAVGRHALGDEAMGALPTLALDAPLAGQQPDIDTDPDPQSLRLTPAHLAYVIYTSGSSGKPKGVAMTHGSLVNLMQWQHDVGVDLSGKPNILQFAALGFDVAFQEIFSALSSGACLVLIDESMRLDPGQWVEFVRTQNIECMFLPFIALQNFAEAAVNSGQTLPLLKNIITAGEQLRISPALQQLAEKAPGLHLHNHYGPTETHVVTAYTLAEAPAAWPTLPPIGRPISNTRIYLLDAYGQPVPLGAVGELYIGGAGVARGYLRTELTAERFLRDPFCDEPYGRMYRSGDLARYRAGGQLEFLGRADQQVKIRGYRIEPGEIESRLIQQPGVREAVVLVRVDNAGNKRLVAYVVPQPETSLEAGELRARLARQLPDYMLPSAFVTLDALPLTPNGKLDRRALSASDGTVLVQRAYEAPQGEIEQALAAIWSELLDVATIGRHDHFFESGGHSLLAVRLLSRLHSRLGVALPLATLFAQPTLADLAEAVSQSSLQSPTAMTRVSRDGPLVLSFAQQRLWLLAQLKGVSATYHLPFGLRLSGPLDRTALRRSLDALWRRHEALRTVFNQHGGQPIVSLLDANAGFALIEHDLQNARDAQPLLRRWCAEEAQASFDLSQGPLIRGRLLCLDTQQHVLLLTQHHIVSDGWSLGVFFNELSALYRAFAAGQDHPLPPLAIQYPDYAAWQRNWLSGDRLQTQVAYWRNQLVDAPVLLELPTDRPRPAQRSFAGATLDVVIDAELTRDLKRLSHQHGTTLFMTLLAAWAAVLSRLSGQQDLVIGTPTANRGRQELESLIGFFVNTLALRIDLSDEPSVAELLARVRTHALAAQDHQDLPFEQVLEIVQPPRRLDHTPLFQVMFAWQNNEQTKLKLAGLQVTPVDMPYDSTKFDLELSLGEHGDRIVGEMSYAVALFDRITIERQRDYLIRVLRAMVADASQPVSRIDILGEDERNQLLHTWNRTEVAYPDAVCIHQLFEQQVQRHPEAVAIVHGEQATSYDALNAQANRLAHQLIENGVRAGDRVALLLERGVALITAQLAILKAGAAYVPLDRQAPSSRLAAMLADCTPRLLITDAAHASSAMGDLAVLTIDSDLLDTYGSTNHGLSLSAEAIAYVIYTSGSTGTPKGVVVPHRAISRLVINNHYAAFDSNARVAFAANPAFDASTMEVWGPLLHGGRVIVIDADTFTDATRFSRAISQHRITVLFLTTALFNQYASSMAPALAQVEYLLCGGEREDMASFAALLSEAGTQRLVHCYGPTESTTFATSYEVVALDETMQRLPIGRPIANTRTYLLDKHRQPVPLGTVGELYIGGAGVAHGYLNRPELTAERFLLDPFSPHPDARMYKTGDLARYLPDGNLLFVGRNDDQVKLRGFRIEPGEIEARLIEHPEVREAVVIALESGNRGKYLAAYVVTAGQAATLDVAGVLRAHLLTDLPDYMIPAAFVVLPSLPLTPNGKLDRKALPVPDDAAFARQKYEPPQGEIEQMIGSLWEQLLGIQRVGRHDHFFELGGHSLLAARLVNQVSEIIDVSIELSSVFSHPRLSSFAKHVLIASLKDELDDTDLLELTNAEGTTP
jgi:natural product biosynthesis luciferase-like monooxygenase protein/amino acid adenylation domain-containing protein